MTKSKKLTFKLFRGQNVSASRVENERAGGAKNEKWISEAARLLDRWEYKYFGNWWKLLLYAVLITYILAETFVLITDSKSTYNYIHISFDKKIQAKQMVNIFDQLWSMLADFRKIWKCLDLVYFAMDDILVAFLTRA